jgi:hypothetical protein
MYALSLSYRETSQYLLRLFSDDEMEVRMRGRQFQCLEFILIVPIMNHLRNVREYKGFMSKNDCSRFTTSGEMVRDIQLGAPRSK